MSIVEVDEERRGSKVVAIDRKTGPKPRKVLEEDEYLDRMASIIRRDFFIDASSEHKIGTPSFSQVDSERSNQTFAGTPGTGRTDCTTTSSVKSMRDLRSMRLNEYLEKYTSEDNAYFDKLQRKDLKRHRSKYPWLYTKRDGQKKDVVGRSQITSGASERLAIEGPSSSVCKASEYTFNKNSLFYPPDQATPQRAQSTVNYESSKYMQEPIFKEPLPARSNEGLRGLNRFTDKIGIDGKLLNGSETPSMNGFTFLPTPDTPISSDDRPKSKFETNRYYLPSESPRDDLAHRLYESKIAKKIRTPRTSTRSDSTKTPQSRLDKIF